METKHGPFLRYDKFLFKIRLFFLEICLIDVIMISISVRKIRNPRREVREGVKDDKNSQCRQPGE